MAKTYVKRELTLAFPDDPYLAASLVKLPEAASQTFPKGSPVSFVSGKASVFVAPTTALLAGFALDAASGTTDNLLRVILALPWVAIEANFLGSAAADNVLAATDLGVAYDLAAGTTSASGAAGWYLQDSTSDASVIISSFESYDILPDSGEMKAVAGDTNARVRGRVKPGKSLWF